MAFEVDFIAQVSQDAEKINIIDRSNWGDTYTESDITSISVYLKQDGASDYITYSLSGADITSYLSNAGVTVLLSAFTGSETVFEDDFYEVYVEIIFPGDNVETKTKYYGFMPYSRLKARKLPTMLDINYTLDFQKNRDMYLLHMLLDSAETDAQVNNRTGFLNKMDYINTRFNQSNITIDDID
jgi:hypothetical protein